MVRLIDEKKLIEELRKYADELGTVRGEIELANGVLKAISIINEQPKVGEWIPVEERLPESCEYVLVSCVNGAVEYGAYYAGDKDWSLISTDRQCKVLAWQPLPKPYEVKEND